MAPQVLEGRDILWGEFGAKSLCKQLARCHRGEDSLFHRQSRWLHI